MQCPRCQHDHPPQSSFCLECGGRVTLTCGACGADLPSGSRFCNHCGTPVHPSAAARPRFGSPEAYTPKHLAEKILTSKACARRRAQARDRAVRRPQGLDGAPRRPGPRGGAATPRSGPGADDGGGPSLRGHGEPGDGRRDHGAVRRADRARRPRRPRLLCRAPDAGIRQSVRRRGAARARRDGADPRRAQLRRGRGRRDRQRPAHGLHGGRGDDASRRAHGTGRAPGHGADRAGDARPGRRVRRRDAPWPSAGERSPPAGRGLRAVRHRSGAHATAGRRATRVYLVRRPGRRDRGASPIARARRRGTRAGRRHRGRGRRGEIPPPPGSSPGRTTRTAGSCSGAARSPMRGARRTCPSSSC